MAGIQLLDPVTIGQIAAGEVIERPMSIVKELVENAVDAGATRVTVIVERGGTERIEVIDDGAGIAPDQLALAVRRHATSKLSTIDDLESVATLGFRGEGLASIAAVAKVELRSRTDGAEIGSRVLAFEESAGAIEPMAAPRGTQVIVTELFANIPVRREYLRSPSAEFTRISNWLTTFTLAYPHVTFTLRHDGKDVWVMPSTGDERERLAMVFGRDAAANLIPLQDEAARMLDGRVRGFISAAGKDRPDRRMQLLFVNGRLLKSQILTGAWTAGYSTFAMVGRYPYGVIFLDLPPDHVDPNVHPTKSDVRLRYSSNVFDAVRRAIGATLRSQATQHFNDMVAPSPVSLAPSGIDASLAHVQSLFEHPTDADYDEVPVQRLRVLAQVHHTFILASDGESVVLLDQHAAHERIAYESIVKRAQDHAPNEPLLVPLVLELDTGQTWALERTLDLLREGGLDIEPFGENTYRITATPAGYSARPFDLTGFLNDLSIEPKQRDVRERIWASLACHSVTVAGERLSMEEMTSLVDRLQLCGNPMHCPHGRPTMVRIPHEDIAKMFKRI